MNPNWLTQLAPSHAPAAVGWWPPAPGWWILVLLCILLVAYCVWKLRDPRRALRRAALRQLRIIRSSDADGAAVARATENLIRRYALEVFGRERVARLTGEAWLNFVMDAGGSALAGAPGRSMLAAAFGNSGADDHREQWIAAAEGFIRKAGRGRRSTPGAQLKPASASPGARVATEIGARPSAPRGPGAMRAGGGQ